MADYPVQQEKPGVTLFSVQGYVKGNMEISKYMDIFPQILVCYGTMIYSP